MTINQPSAPRRRRSPARRRGGEPTRAWGNRQLRSDSGQEVGTQPVAGGPLPTQEESGDVVSRLRQAISDWEKGNNPPLIDQEHEDALKPLQERAVRLINHRPRSVHELRERLLQGLRDDHRQRELHALDPERHSLTRTARATEHCDASMVEEVVQRCIENKMLDDATFAAEWVTQRHRTKKKSVSALRSELQAKGVARHLIDAALDEISAEEEYDVLYTLLEKKAQSITQYPASPAERDKNLRRLLGMGARRGFPEGQCMSLARQLLEERYRELSHEDS